jgi:hypothetical protein
MDSLLSDEAPCRGEPPHRRGGHRFVRELVELLRSEEARGAQWFIGGSVFIVFTAFVWGLTINPTKATKWTLLLGPPLILVVGLGGGLLSWAKTS